MERQIMKLDEIVPKIAEKTKVEDVVARRVFRAVRSRLQG